MRILLVKTSSMGDVIHNLPVVSDIVAGFPDAKIDWVVEENFVDIPSLHPGVCAVIPVAWRRWRKSLFSSKTWTEIAAFRRALSTENYDYIIDTQGLIKSAMITRLAHGQRYGFDAASARESWSAIAYRHKYAVSTTLHAVQRNRELVAQVMRITTPGALNYGLIVSPDKQLSAASAVLLTATSRDDKLWPETDWIALGQHLAKRGLLCLLPGGNALELARAARLAESIPNASAMAAQGLSALAKTISSATVVVGVDTGLVHLAAALGRPTVAIYCASDPALTGVLATTPFANLGAKGKAPTVAEVIVATDDLLAEAR